MATAKIGRCAVLALLPELGIVCDVPVCLSNQVLGNTDLTVDGLDELIDLFLCTTFGKISPFAGEGSVIHVGVWMSVLELSFTFQEQLRQYGRNRQQTIGVTSFAAIMRVAGVLVAHLIADQGPVSRRYLCERVIGQSCCLAGAGTAPDHGQAGDGLAMLVADIQQCLHQCDLLFEGNRLGDPESFGEGFTLLFIDIPLVRVRT